ncbi:MAG: tetratricopeptide repeat-containing protein [Acidobacteria bacterium]|nr:tetratricopeptide repeat-containing protein [Acidobacteriota bacterium]
MAGWEAIAEAVGDLPLALDLLNAVLQFDLSPQQLRQRLDEAVRTPALDQRAAALKNVVPPGALRGITETFALSFEKLSTPARQAALVLAQLEPGTPIPEAVIEALPPELNSTEVRITLRQRNFVTGEAEGVFGEMHRVLAGYLREQAGPDDANRARDALLAVMKPDRCEHPDHWPTMNACARHARPLFLRLATDALTEPNDAVATGGLGVGLGILWCAQGDAAQARTLQEQVLAVMTRVLGPEHPNTLTSMNNLAETMGAQGDHAGARALHEQVLAVSRRVLGPEHLHTLTSMNNLAKTLVAQGDAVGARTLQEQVLAMLRRVLGPEHPHTLSSIKTGCGIPASKGSIVWRDGAKLLQAC